MPTTFRGITRREGMLIEGPAGWAEFSPFLDYDARESAPWLAAAIDSAEREWPAPLRDRVAVLDEPLELGLVGELGGAALLAADAAGVQEVLGEEAGLDGLGELDLADGVEQRGARNLVEVEADAVASLDLPSVRDGGGHGPSLPTTAGRLTRSCTSHNASKGVG